jgi:hypothetical protein
VTSSDGTKRTCQTKIIVVPVVNKPLPVCTSFTANKLSLPTGGSNVTLSWVTKNATKVTINNGVGQFINNETSKVVNVTKDTTFNLIAENASGDKDQSCQLTIDVDEGSSLSCPTFVSNRDVVSVGNKYTLTWDVVGNPNSVSIDNGVGSGLASGGSIELTAPNNDTTITYTLTATKTGEQPLTCTTNVRIDKPGGGGGGGGGSSSPRCKLNASDTKISAGDEITLTWDNSRTRDLTLFEGTVRNGEKIFETSDSKLVEDGSFKVRPTKDTTYTLLAERGGKDDQCTVKIDVSNNVVISSTRAQGQVAGIALTAVPYTGFEAGPVLTFIFYMLLAIWAIGVAYFFVIKENRVLGMSMAGSFPKKKILNNDVSTETVDDKNETSEAAAYVASMTAQSDVVVPLATATNATTPDNLPVAEPVLGYDQVVSSQTNEETESEDVATQMKQLEDFANAQRVLLSSDAMHHLVTVCPKEVDRVSLLETILAEARISYPSEDGWIVLNFERMKELCDKSFVSVNENSTTEVFKEKSQSYEAYDMPVGVGSLAEAMITGNLAAAYQLLGNRPMISLADAAADFDALYRSRKGDQVVISNLLSKEAVRLDDRQLEEAISALTSALDGTYTDELSAVKMAIMKAVKALV